MRKIFAVGIVLLFCSESFAQMDSALFAKWLDTLKIEDLFPLYAKKSYFKAQVSYLTNSVYAGRKDTAALPYLTPSIEYNHKSGFYASVSASYLANKNSRLDVWNAEIGFSTDTIGRFSGSIYANKPFYNNNSGNVQSDVKFYTGAAISFDARYININAAGTVMFSDERDFSLQLSADHSFYVEPDSGNFLITITPTVSSFFGSTGYYQEYKKTVRLRNGQTGQAKAQLTSPNTFQVLSYEFSLPIYFDTRNWGIFVNPTYVIPVNPVTTTIKWTGPNGGVLTGPNFPTKITESISNSLYAELGFYYKF